VPRLWGLASFERSRAPDYSRSPRRRPLEPRVRHVPRGLGLTGAGRRVRGGAYRIDRLEEVAEADDGRQTRRRKGRGKSIRRPPGSGPAPATRASSTTASARAPRAAVRLSVELDHILHGRQIRRDGKWIRTIATSSAACARWSALSASRAAGLDSLLALADAPGRGAQPWERGRPASAAGSSTSAQTARPRRPRFPVPPSPADVFDHDETGALQRRSPI